MLDDDDARREAAEILRPLYEADGLHEKLAPRPRDRGRVRRSISAQARRRSRAPCRSPTGPCTTRCERSPTRRAACARRSPIRSCRRGSSASSSSPRSPASIAELVELLRSTAGEIVDGDVQLEVTLRIAEIARTPLADTALARSTTRRPSTCAATSGARSSRSSRSTKRRATRGAARHPEAPRRRGRERRRAQAAPLQAGAPQRRDARRYARGHHGLRADPRARPSTEGDRRARAPLRPDRALGRSHRALRASDLAPGSSNERKAALHHALGTRPREANGRRRARVRRVRGGARDRPEAPATVASLETLMGKRERSARGARCSSPSTWRASTGGG